MYQFQDLMTNKDIWNAYGLARNNIFDILSINPTEEN